MKFKNSTVATTGNPDEERLIKELWPDQAQGALRAKRHTTRAYPSHLRVGHRDHRSAYGGLIRLIRVLTVLVFGEPLVAAMGALQMRLIILD